MVRKHEHDRRRNDYDLSAVKFSRLTRRGIILGLSLPQLITLAIGILSIVAALYAGGGILIAYAAPIWLLAAVLTWVPAGGRKLIEWVPVGFRWIWRGSIGPALYRRRVVEARPAGAPAPPGGPAAPGGDGARGA